MAWQFRVGADENGLGAQLGPLIVTAVLARVDSPQCDKLWKRLPKKLARDLDDSKRLVAHGSVALGEAWARALMGERATTPSALFHTLSLDSQQDLRAPCPNSALPQCWSDGHEQFVASDETVARLRGHLQWLRDRGVEVQAARTSATCAKRLNEGKRAGGNRFTADLHAMERLVLALREVAGSDVHAVCGKVGGIGDYSRYFGPLSDRLHAVLQVDRAHSAYHFPGLGELHFVRDADGKDPLVMLASLIGKYVRELLMARISSFYALRDAQGEPLFVSGYNDPRTARFVKLTQRTRNQQAIPNTCFKREGDLARS